MPTYYFHVRDNGVLIKDSVGVEVDDLSAAGDQCRQLILSVLREEQTDKELLANREFQVEDERGRTVLIVPFRLALSLVRAGDR